AVERLRAQGGGGPALRRLPHPRRHQRARPLRDRRERDHPLELRLARRDQPRRRRDPGRPGAARRPDPPHRGELTMTTMLTLPVGDRDHAQGDARAPITLVEYGDYECPYCGRAYPIIKRVQERFGERLRFVYRNFPLAEIHPHALHAAEAAESVAARAGNDAFWAMHDLVFEHQRNLTDATLADLAARAGADAAAVLGDLE